MPIRMLSSLLVLLAAQAVLAAEPSEAEGVQAAEAWLKLVDGSVRCIVGRVGRDVPAGDPPRRMGEEGERGACAAGEGLSRKLASKQLTHALPGAPDGTYVVLVYASRFEHKEQARETVTVALDSGERFRAAGYFIR